jgi:hypothetical protein
LSNGFSSRFALPVACDGFFCVYGGHVAPVHTYPADTASGRFHRLAIEDAPRRLRSKTAFT